MRKEEKEETPVSTEDTTRESSTHTHTHTHTWWDTPQQRQQPSFPVSSRQESENFRCDPALRDSFPMRNTNEEQQTRWHWRRHYTSALGSHYHYLSASRTFMLQCIMIHRYNATIMSTIPGLLPPILLCKLITITVSYSMSCQTPRQWCVAWM